MTMMNGFDVRELDILDEEYFGPPPRFLVDRCPVDRGATVNARPIHDADVHPLTRIRDLLGV